MLLKSFRLCKVIRQPDGLVSGFILSLLLLLDTMGGQSQETDLSQTIKAMPGDDVVLPCHAEPRQDPSQITVEWGRPDLRPRFVHVWHNQKEYLADQNTAYKGRTSLFSEKINDGDLSLKLSDVRHSDNGKYRCYNPKDKKEYFTQLIVGSVSSPGISLAGLDKSSGAVMLDCSSGGWYPEPEVFWFDGEGNVISAKHRDTITDPGGVYTVSSKVTLGKRQNNTFTCRVQQNDINRTRETHIFVPDGFFVKESNCSASISFNIIFAILLVSGVIFQFWIKQQKNKKKKSDNKYPELQTLMIAEKLDEDLKKSNEEQKRTEEQIKALTVMLEELKEQKKNLLKETQETEESIVETDEKFQKVKDKLYNQGNTKEKKAQGFLELKEILTESIGKLTERKQYQQQAELMIDSLMKKTGDEVTKLQVRKQETDEHLGKIKEKQAKLSSKDGFNG